MFSTSFFNFYLSKSEIEKNFFFNKKKNRHRVLQVVKVCGYQGDSTCCSKHCIPDPHIKKKRKKRCSNILIPTDNFDGNKLRAPEFPLTDIKSIDHSQILFFSFKW
ncbi:hypothetical protein Mgra_00002512 [Meloidogyne graminicola]|uniref:Uncharacterized protein n=1 Tax=Meloidogyne graminicola TaxID=189291 RepID=A0A8S9ZY52_9BILA|nr:hypothetical protein Mgra_00002512 [Meloidogyne graminicola]